MADNEINIRPKQILAAIHQHLSGHFFDATKTDAKQTFNQLNDGKSIALLQITSDGHGDVTGRLFLDSSEFVGKLNYSAFRDALASHLQHVGERLRNEEKLNVMTSEDTGAMLFHLPGVVEHDHQRNFLVTGVEQNKPGEIAIKLMFLSPTIYADL